MIGKTAGIGNDYKEQDGPEMYNPLTQVSRMLSGPMDMTQLNNFMQSSGYLLGMPVPMQPPPEAPAPQATSYHQQGTFQAPPEVPKEVEEAPPGMDDEEEAPPGF